MEVFDIRVALKIISKLREELEDAKRHEAETVEVTEGMYRRAETAEAELAKMRDELAEKDEMITALRMRCTECTESNKDVESALEGFSYSGSYGDGVRKMRDELVTALAELENFKLDLELATQRADLAEDKLREAERQEPFSFHKFESTDDYVDGYEFRGDDGDYTPNETERMLITDALEGYLSLIPTLYARHIPPSDVAELQEKYDRLDKISSEAAELNNTQAQRIAELEREIRELKRDVSTISKQRDDLVDENLRLVECNAQMERKLAEQQAVTIPDNSQDWAGMDGAIAWHLIERHAENWADIGKMMHEWLEANSAKARAEAVPEEKKMPPLYADEPVQEQRENAANVNGWNDCRNKVLAAVPKPEATND